jgi:hypothetical protein
MLTGAAWQAHRAKKKARALHLGMRALLHAPGDVLLWTNIAALLVKSVKREKNQ